MSLTSSVSSHNPIQSEIKRTMNGEKIGKSFLSKLKQTFRLLLFFLNRLEGESKARSFKGLV